MSGQSIRARAASVRESIHRARSSASDGLAADGWTLLQGTAAATIAWLIARDVLGHEAPFFAPISAVIALNAPRGERGRNALRLLVGVVVGIIAGEMTVGLLGEGYGRLAVAISVAVLGARALGGARLVIGQAASSAILTVVAADGNAGPNRLVDALTGAGVALTFILIFFTPEPVRLLRRAQTAVLARMAAGLRKTARALESDDARLADSATDSLRLLFDRLAALKRARLASKRVARYSLIWRSRMSVVVLENENADHLDLLGVSCLMLARATAAIESPDRRMLAPVIHELAAALREMARDPGDRAHRQRGIDQALDASRRLVRADVPPGAALHDALRSAQNVAADIIVFAGVDPKTAHAAVRAGRGEFEAPARASTRAAPFGLELPALRWPGRSATELPQRTATKADERPEK